MRSAPTLPNRPRTSVILLFKWILFKSLWGKWKVNRPEESVSRRCSMHYFVINVMVYLAFMSYFFF